MISDKLNLTISTLNVNSLNVATLGGKVSKTFVKIEGRLGKKRTYYFYVIVEWVVKGKKLRKCLICLAMGSIKYIITLTRKVGE